MHATKLFRFGRWIFRHYLRFFFNLHVYRAPIHIERGMLIAANHASFLDPPIVGSSTSCPIHFLARDSLFQVPLLGRLLHYVHAHPLYRGHANAKMLRVVEKLLDAKAHILLFPEGGRTADGCLQPPKPGIGMLALQLQLSIRPVYIAGSYEVWPRGRLLPRLKGKISCVWGTPISWEEIDKATGHLERKEAQKWIAERVMERIAELRRWYEEGAIGTPP